MNNRLAFRLPPVVIQLSDTNGSPGAPEWIQVIRAGTFWKGDKKIEVTNAMLASMKKNFDARVRGIDIACDYFHESDKIAAGWFKELDLRDGGEALWGKMKWTAKANAMLADQELRYVSADIDFDYEDNETKKKFGPTLLGAGLTNRPVVKGMAPTTALTEHKEGNDMDEKQLAELKDRLEKLEKGNKELAEKNGKLEEKCEKLQVKLDESADDKSKDKGDDDGDQEAECGEFDEGAFDEKAFDEMSDEDKASAMKAAVAKLKKGKKATASEKREAKFDEMVRKGKAVPAQKEAFMKGDMVAFAESAQPVKVIRQGSGGIPEVEGRDTTAQDKIIKLANEKVSEAKEKGKRLSLAEAQATVLLENPKLRIAYEREVSFTE